MDKKLEKIYRFLKDNRRFNKEVQTSFYNSVLSPYKTKEDKVISLLYNVVNTQSAPDMDKLYVFLKKITDNKSKLKTFKGFLSIIGKVDIKGNSYETLYHSINKKGTGWGPKTSALFVKSIFHLHNGQYNYPNFKLWDDISMKINKDDQLYLPVDNVIKFIFRNLKFEKQPTFTNINKLLFENYKLEIDVWDDLWFWGFITQNSSNGERKLDWNEAKYWANIHTNKNEKTIKAIREKAKEFIKLIS